MSVLFLCYVIQSYFVCQSRKLEMCVCVCVLKGQGKGSDLNTCHVYNIPGNTYRIVSNLSSARTPIHHFQQPILPILPASSVPLWMGHWFRLQPVNK